MSEAIVEIRDYAIEPAWFDAYRDWARDHAAPWLKANLDVIDFWVDDGIEPQVAGSSPVEPPNGQPNVCWIIHWPSRDARDVGYAAFTDNPEWHEIWAKHPNPNAYLQVTIRFMKPAVEAAAG